MGGVRNTRSITFRRLTVFLRPLWSICSEVIEIKMNLIASEVDNVSRSRSIDIGESDAAHPVDSLLDYSLHTYDYGF